MFIVLIQNLKWLWDQVLSIFNFLNIGALFVQFMKFHWPSLLKQQIFNNIQVFTNNLKKDSYSKSWMLKVFAVQAGTFTGHLSLSECNLKYTRESQATMKFHFHE